MRSRAISKCWSLRIACPQRFCVGSPVLVPFKSYIDTKIETVSLVALETLWKLMIWHFAVKSSAVSYTMMSYTVLQIQWYNHALKSQKTPDTSPSRASYGPSLVIYWGKWNTLHRDRTPVAYQYEHKISHIILVIVWYIQCRPPYSSAWPAARLGPQEG